MANQLTILKFRNLKFTIPTALILGCFPAYATPVLEDGIYVSDESSDAIHGGQSLERIKKFLNKNHSSGIKEGTTAMFSYSFLVKNGKATVFRTISNAANEKYEFLSSTAPVNISTNPNGKIDIDYTIEKYYPNEITIGSIPKKISYSLNAPILAQISGNLNKNGELIISKCSTLEKKHEKWTKSTDYLGICEDREITFFNIRDLIANKKNWNFAK